MLNRGPSPPTIGRPFQPQFIQQHQQQPPVPISPSVPQYVHQPQPQRPMSPQIRLQQQQQPVVIDPYYYQQQQNHFFSPPPQQPQNHQFPVLSSPPIQSSPPRKVRKSLVYQRSQKRNNKNDSYEDDEHHDDEDDDHDDSVLSDVSADEDDNDDFDDNQTKLSDNETDREKNDDSVFDSDISIDDDETPDNKKARKKKKSDEKKRPKKKTEPLGKDYPSPPHLLRWFFIVMGCLLVNCLLVFVTIIQGVAVLSSVVNFGMILVAIAFCFYIYFFSIRTEMKDAADRWNNSKKDFRARKRFNDQHIKINLMFFVWIAFVIFVAMLSFFMLSADLLFDGEIWNQIVNVSPAMKAIFFLDFIISIVMVVILSIILSQLYKRSIQACKNQENYNLYEARAKRQIQQQQQQQIVQ